MSEVRVLIGDDHPLCRFANRATVLATWPDALINEAGSFCEVIEVLTSENAAGFDLVLLDLGMPDRPGLAGLLAVASAAPGTSVLVVSGNEAPDLARDVRAAGAIGLVSKSAPISDLLAAMQSVRAGQPWFDEAKPNAIIEDANSRSARLSSLTRAERRVLAAICDGSLNKQIAYRLDLSEITIKQHVKAILRKLQVANRTQAALLMQFTQGRALVLN